MSPRVGSSLPALDALRANLLQRKADAEGALDLARAELNEASDKMRLCDQTLQLVVVALDTHDQAVAAMQQPPPKREHRDIRQTVLDMLSGVGSLEFGSLCNQLPDVKPSTLKKSLASLIKARQVENPEPGTWRLAPS